MEVFHDNKREEILRLFPFSHEVGNDDWSHFGLDDAKSTNIFLAAVFFSLPCFDRNGFFFFNLFESMMEGDTV